MKKIGVLLILFLLLPSIVISQTNNTNQSEIEKTMGSLREEVLKILEKPDKVVEKPIAIPEDLQPLAKILFSLEENSSLSLFIITLCIWILFLTIFINIFTLFSIFSRTTSIVTAIVLTIILAATSLIRTFAILLTNTAGGLKILESSSAGAIFFWLLVLVIIWFIVRNVFARAREHQLLENARQRGIKAGTSNVMSSWINKIFQKFGS